MPHSASLHRILSQIRSLLDVAGASALEPIAEEKAGTLSIHRALAWSRLWVDPGSKEAFELLSPIWAEAVEPDGLIWTDSGGHARPVYRGLAIYCALQAIRASNHVLVAKEARGVMHWIESLSEDLPITPEEVVPASKGAQTAGDAWMALALYASADLLSDDRCRAASRRYFAGLVASQRPAGNFLQATPRDNLESFWFHELQILHAISSYAMQSGNEAALAACRTAAAYHVAETQPDHATQDPWALPAFAMDESTIAMADQLLHASAALPTAKPTAVALILLTDNLYSLRRLKELQARI